MRTLALLLVLALSFVSSSAFAATLNVIGGQLMGASDVLVDGNLYDVQFLDGTCIDLYNGCDEASDFTFQTQASAVLASRALLDQVFLDGVEGQFDSSPQLTNGCSFSQRCVSVSPYALSGSPLVVIVAGAHNGAPGVGDNPQIPVPVSRDVLVSATTYSTYAVWTASVVPEPSTALLLGLGLTGLAGKGRKRNRS
jgi:hypothetical protein